MISAVLLKLAYSVSYIIADIIVLNQEANDNKELSWKNTWEALKKQQGKNALA